MQSCKAHLRLWQKVVELVPSGKVDLAHGDSVILLCPALPSLLAASCLSYLLNLCEQWSPSWCLLVGPKWVTSPKNVSAK